MIQIHGTKIQISQEGIVSAWDQYYVESEGGVDDVPTKRNSVGGSGVLDLVEISSSQAEEGKQHVVTAKYEGLAAERFVNRTYEWSPEESQTDIILNPNIKELWLRYGGRWDDDMQDVKWPKTLKNKKGQETENPMLGVTDWIDLFGMWTETKAQEAVGEDVFQGVWSIVDEVPGGFPTPRNRAWLVLPPQITQRGACFEIKNRWRLTGVMTRERLEASRLIYTPIQ